MTRKELIDYIIKTAITYEKNKGSKADEIFLEKIKFEVKNNKDNLKGEKNEV